MKKLILLSGLLAFSGSISSGQNFAWVKNVEANGTVLVDNSGNIYTAGYFRGTFDADPGPGVLTLSADGMDIYLIKSDPSGNLIWAQRYGGSSNTDALTSIGLDEDANLYLTGYFNGTTHFVINNNPTTMTANGNFDLFVAKMDSSGETKWVSQFGTADAFPTNSGEMRNGIAVDANSNTYVTGRFWNVMDFDPGNGTTNLGSQGKTSAYVIKMSSTGNVEWAKAFTGTDVSGATIAADDNGNVYVGSRYFDSVDFDPGAGTHWQVTTSMSSSVTKLDVDGNFVWSKPVDLNCDHIHILSDDVFLSGAGTVHRLDNSGNVIWTKTIGLDLSLAGDKYGDLYLAGNFSWTHDFDPGAGVYYMTTNDSQDIFVLKLDHSGNFIWSKRIGAQPGGIARPFFNSLDIDESLNIYMTGSYYGKPDFDPGIDSFYLQDTLNGNFMLKLDTVQTPLSIIYGASAKTDITVYPNPTSNVVYFQMGNNGDPVHVRVMNTAGQVMIEFSPKEVGELSIDLSPLLSGVYWIELQNGDLYTRAKVVRK